MITTDTGYTDTIFLLKPVFFVLLCDICYDSIFLIILVTVRQ